MVNTYLEGMSQEAVRAILDARTARLARRDDGSSSFLGEDSDALLICAVERELYGVFIDQVSAVVPWRRPSAIPGSPPTVLGLIAERAMIYNLVDMGGVLGTGAPGVRQDGMLLLLRHPRPRVALAVDRVLRVTSSYQPAMEGERPPAAPESMTAFMREQGEAQGFALLDIDLLLKPLLALSTNAGAH